jgi:lysophospholipase L1-like esterase|tara:strand:+ start:5052 stop:6014 length:963 start_codon:yes stop_codon:yes gene_type:complete
MNKKNKNFISNIFLSFLSIFLVFLIIEIYVRIIIDDGSNLNIEMLKYAKSLKIISDNKDVGLEHKKNIKKKLMGVHIHLNSQGFRNNIDIDNSKKKILMLGDSMTLGWGSNETFSSNLEKSINKKIQVLNAGIGNTNSYMQINNFFENFKKYDFDLIILNFFINDFERVKINHANFIENNLYSFTYLKTKIIKILIYFSLANNWENFYKKTYEDEEFINESLDQIARLNNYCKKENIMFVINNIPELRDLKNYRFFKETEIIRNFSKKNDIMFIDSFDTLKNHDEDMLMVSKEDAHSNDKAHLLIAEFLEKKLFSQLNSL